MFDEQNLILEMLEAGAKGYLLKNARKDEIMNAIKSVNKDEPYYCKNIDKILRQIKADINGTPFKKQGKPDFTVREIEIIKLICNQYSNKEIAGELELSKRTIEGYRQKILEKIDAKNTVGIVLYAVKNKIF